MEELRLKPDHLREEHVERTGHYRLNPSYHRFTGDTLVPHSEFCPVLCDQDIPRGNRLFSLDRGLLEVKVRITRWPI